MALNNNALFNAAYSGFVEGALAGRSNWPTTGTPFATLASAAQAFATEVDAQVAFDGTITTAASNTLLALTTAQNAQSAPEIAKISLMKSIAKTVCQGRYSTDVTAADYATIAGVVKTNYQACIASLVTP